MQLQVIKGAQWKKGKGCDNIIFCMSGIEEEGSRFDPNEVAKTSGALWQLALEEGHAISKKVAIAQRMGNIGRDMIKEVLTGKSHKNIAPDINFVFEGLGNEAKIKFQLGIGGILLASIISSLEDGVINGWRDGSFIDDYNSRIIGTPMPSIKMEELSTFSKISSLTAEDETSAIYKEVKRDPSFLGFFDGEHHVALPKTVLAFLNSQPSLMRGLFMVLPYYKEAVKRLE